MSTLKIKRENGKIFCPLADSWHIETPEEKVRQEYIKSLFRKNDGKPYSIDGISKRKKRISLYEKPLNFEGRHGL